VGESLPELAVLDLQLRVSSSEGVELLSERVGGGPLGGRPGRAVMRRSGASELVDHVSEIRLAIKPGSRDTRGASDGADIDWLTSAVEAAQSCNGTAAGVVVAFLGCSDQAGGLLR